MTLFHVGECLIQPNNLSCLRKKSDCGQTQCVCHNQHLCLHRKELYLIHCYETSIAEMLMRHWIWEYSTIFFRGIPEEDHEVPRVSPGNPVPMNSIEVL